MHSIVGVFVEIKLRYNFVKNYNDIYLKTNNRYVLTCYEYITL